MYILSVLCGHSVCKGVQIQTHIYTYAMLQKYHYLLESIHKIRFPLVALGFALFFLAGAITVHAQFSVEGTVVSAEDNSALPGVTVVEVGTQTGTVTESDGSFSLTVSGQNVTLRFSFIGYDPLTLDLEGRSEITVRLQSIVELMDEVVVTAHGLERDRKAIGYSISQVRANDLVQGTEANVANLLQGQVAGAEITPTGGGVGSSSRVVIRGVSSLEGDNQPLYVVDGVPIDNRNYGSVGMWGGFDGGDGIQSLNASDIESISVLKGASASALYGERARDGVILITTKKGSAGRINVNFSNTTTFDMAHVDYNDYQTEYGQGFSGLRPQTEEQAHSSMYSSWGEPFDGQSTIQMDGEMRPYEDTGSRIGEFYRTGTSLRNDLSVSGGVEDATYYFSASNLNTRGITENNDLTRTSLTLRGTASLGRLHADVKANYVNEGVNGRPNLSDAPANSNFAIMNLVRNVPLSAIKNFVYREDGTAREIQRGNIFTQNPYWAVWEIGNSDERDRLIGHVKLDLDITDWLILTGRTGLDYYSLRRSNWVGWGTNHNLPGSFNDQDNRVHESNTDLFLSAVYDVTPSFSVDALAGGALRNSQFEQLSLNGGDYIVPGKNVINNMRNSTTGYDFSEKEIRSVYGSLNLGYNDYLFLNLTGRNDWSSTLPVDANSFFYPSVGVSFVFSEAFQSALPSWLSFGQLRGAWAEVGSDTDPYRLNLTYQVQSLTFDGRNFANLGTEVPLADLKPTLTQEVEVGADIRFFDDRLGFDFAWYDRQTTNQILSAQIPRTSGFTNRVINAGQIDNTGWELKVTAIPVARADFFWRSMINYARNKSMVVETAEGSELLLLEQSRSQTAWIAAEVGDEFGVIRGYAYARDADGNIIHDNTGRVLQGELTTLGRGTPDWKIGWSNTVSYRNWSLNMLIDMQWGGQIFAATNAYAYASGLHKNTLTGRAECDAAPRTEEGTWTPCFIGQGVMQTGGSAESPVYGPNTTEVTPNQYYGAIRSRIAEEFVYDANVIYMRQIQLSYRVPVDLVSQFGFRGASVAVIARNPFLIYNTVPNVDPTISLQRGNAQGLELAGVPSYRSIGFSIDVQF